MQSRENESFLLQSADDFEDTFSSKLRYFSGFKLEVAIPVRGESSELLNIDGEKNDYDWLLTPPDTPLFPSLDDEQPPVNVASRGRPRSQPVSIPRSSTMEKSHRSSRGSASPNRLSPSLGSGNSTFQSNGRPSSAPHSSPTRSQQSATPSRRPSPPPSKASTSAPRSSTPRRMSTGSGARGTSPVRTSRGNSASPKIRAWQSNIPGLSSEAPPNLRTSLADRPASYVRGSSPASKNSKDSGSKFSRRSVYHVIETLEKDVDFCPDCCREENLVGAVIPDTLIVADESLPVPSIKISKEYKQSDEQDTQVAVPELQPQVNDMESQFVDMVDARVSRHEDRVKQSETSHYGQKRFYSQESSLTMSLMEGSEHSNTTGHRETGQPPAEGAGISVLLKRSISSKGPVVQGRTLVASTITYDDLSYARDCANSLRSSIGYGSTSASSSIDFSSGRHSETRVQRQLSGRKSDLENHRYDLNSRPQSTSSSFSGTLSDGHQTLGLATNTHEENVEVSGGNMKYDRLEETPLASQRILLVSENKELDVSRILFTDAEVPEEDLFKQNDSNRKTDISSSDMPHHTVGIHLEENSAEHDMLNTSLDKLDVTTHSRLASISEIEVESNCCGTGSENDDISTNSRSTINEVQDHPVPAPSDKETTASVLEHNMPDHADGILEESTVMVNCQGGRKARSLSLEEVTDATLFCSSIVHDLAYQAATIAIEKESSEPMEGSRPTVTILGKSSADRKDPRGRPAGKRASKSQKVRQRRAETDAKHSANKTENDENRNDSMVRNVGLPSEMDSMKPPKLESKCNCTIM
ncbi:hypothetical protein OIU78_007411 [Salix suchowensis]|nr:hypothetical protein OIU78_007411 [Salix suchowensis]